MSEICASEEADTEGEQEQGGGSKASSASAGAMLRRLSTHVSHINLEWRNLGCTYNSGGGTKVVLQGGGPGQGRTCQAALPLAAESKSRSSRRARVCTGHALLPGFTRLLAAVLHHRGIRRTQAAKWHPRDTQ